MESPKSTVFPAGLNLLAEEADDLLGLHYADQAVLLVHNRQCVQVLLVKVLGYRVLFRAGRARQHAWLCEHVKSRLRLCHYKPSE